MDNLNFNFLNIKDKLSVYGRIEEVNIKDQDVPRIYRKYVFGAGQNIKTTIKDVTVVITGLSYWQANDEIYADVIIDLRTVPSNGNFVWDKNMIPLTELPDSAITKIAEKLFDPSDCWETFVLFHFSEFMTKKFKRYRDRIAIIRYNFIFLNDGTFIYDYDKYDSFEKALEDAIRFGEDRNDMISLIYPQLLDQRIVSQRF